MVNAGAKVKHATFGKGKVIETSATGVYVAVQFKGARGKYSRTVPSREVQPC